MICGLAAPQKTEEADLAPQGRRNSVWYARLGRQGRAEPVYFNKLPKKIKSKALWCCGPPPPIHFLGAEVSSSDTLF